MITWNTDIEAAKSKGWVLICVDNEKRWVGLSCWLEDQQRWNMIATDQVPHGWSEVNHPLTDTPYVKPIGINTSEPPSQKPRKTAPESFTKVATLPVGMNVSLPPGVG